MERFVSDPDEEYRRWEPTEGLPEVPGADIECRTLGERYVAIVLRYSWMVGYDGPDLRLDFPGFHLFELSPESASPWMDNQVPSPRVRSSQWPEFAWPLTEVLNSRWLAGLSDERLVPWDRQQFRHFSMITLGAQASILTRSAVNARFLPADWSWED